MSDERMDGAPLGDEHTSGEHAGGAPLSGESGASAATSAPDVLTVRGLVKRYPGAEVLHGVDFDVRAGEVHCLLGPNGAGKSTLIKCVSGVVDPTDGEILLSGEPLPAGNPSRALARGVATIYQELDLVEDLTVAESVFLGHEPRRFGLLDRERMRRETRALLDRLDHPRIDPRTRVRELKPAGQQIVSIARALSRDVRLLIMDEPSAILDDGEIETLFGVVRRLTADGVGVVYISHRLDEVRRIGDRVTVLSDGRTVATGLPADTDSDVLVERMVGRRVEQLFPDRPRAVDGTGGGAVGDGTAASRGSGGDGADAPAPLLQVRGLGRAPDVFDVSFDVRAGEVVGIAGLVGAGRSELLRLVYGLEKPDAGEVRVDGRRLRPGSTGAALGAGLGFAPEARKSQGLLLDWSIAKNVTLADLASFRRLALIDGRRERAAAGEQLRALDTRPADPRRLASELSGGNQQKVVLARWLLHRCRVLLLDEPTRGVDVGAKAEIYRLIQELAAGGVAVVMVSSELIELVNLCTRVHVMREGRFVAEVDGADATELSLLRHAVAMSPSASKEEVA
jgi:ribose transport system ATP-binding protein